MRASGVSARRRWPTKRERLEAAVEVLHTSFVPDVLPCRARETHKLQEFVENHVGASKPGALYLCGSPGSGKSASMVRPAIDSNTRRSRRDLRPRQRFPDQFAVLERDTCTHRHLPRTPLVPSPSLQSKIVASLRAGGQSATADSSRPRVAWVNAMSLADPRDVFPAILNQLLASTADGDECRLVYDPAEARSRLLRLLVPEPSTSRGKGGRTAPTRPPMTYVKRQNRSFR